MAHNPIARSLRSPHLRPRVVRARKGRGSYKRNPKGTTNG
jgi:stalled ribosome alternative rescue factor ArfA